MSTKTTWEPMPSIPVSWGEVFDKKTILEIKAQRLADAVKKANVDIELRALSQIVGDVTKFPSALPALIAELSLINGKLWDIEEGKRRAEKNQCFDAEFIALARSVYIENDRRAAVKKQINLLLGSTIVEEKSY